MRKITKNLKKSGTSGTKCLKPNTDKGLSLSHTLSHCCPTVSHCFFYSKNNTICACLQNIIVFSTNSVGQVWDRVGHPSGTCSNPCKYYVENVLNLTCPTVPPQNQTLREFTHPLLLSLINL